MIGSFASRQFVAFLITGSFAALVNFLSRVLYNQWVSFSSAVILAYVTGMVTAYILAKAFVFTASQQSMRHSAVWFVLVNLVAVMQTWLISMALAHYLLPAMGVKHFVLELAHAVGIAVPVFTSFLGHKYWSFRA